MAKRRSAFRRFMAVRELNITSLRHPDDRYAPGSYRGGWVRNIYRTSTGHSTRLNDGHSLLNYLTDESSVWNGEVNAKVMRLGYKD